MLKFDAFFQVYNQCQKPQKLKEQNAEKFLTSLWRFIEILQGHWVDFKKHVDAEKLKTEIFPIAQKIFNGSVQIYQKIHPKEELGILGWFRGKSCCRVTYEQGTRVAQYLGYKQHSPGNYFLFTSNTSIPFNDLYEITLPYRTNFHPQCMHDQIFFSLDDTGAPVPEKRSAIIVQQEPTGYTVALYRGEDSPFPYTLCSMSSHIVSEEPLKNNTSYTLFGDTRNRTLFDLVKMPDGFSNKLEYYLKKILKGDLQTFIPFPGTQLEKTEQTYLYLRGKQKERHAQKKKCQEEGQAIPSEKPLFCFERTPSEQSESIPAQEEVTLKAALKTCEQNLLAAYAEEIKEKIQKEQEQRSRDVVEGKHNQSQKSKPQKKQSPQKPKQPSALSDDEIKTKAHAQAEQRLQKLRKELGQTGGFRALLNAAMLNFEALATPMTVSLQGGSHGTLQIGDQKMTLVIPHGTQDTQMPCSTTTRVMNFIIAQYTNALRNQLENMISTPRAS